MNDFLAKKEQTVDFYVTELSHRAHTCDYGELKDSLILDCIVVENFC